MNIPVNQSIIIDVGLLIGGMLAGILGAKKLPVSRNGNNKSPANPGIERSKKTGGALHISEEALGKIDGIKNELKTNYLTEKYHKSICRGNTAELSAEISKEITKSIRESEERIIKAFNGNRKG